MTSRVGYRALIVDNDVYAPRLSQFLMRTELNNRLIQTFSIIDSLRDAYFPAEQSDFIYIDPFTNGLAESIRFIAELLSRSPIKAITLFRSGRQWQDHWRDLDTLALQPMQLRKMLSLDKDLISDASFPQQVRNNIVSMERELQEQIQRHGFHMADVQAGRSGITDLGAMYNFGASGTTMGVNPMSPFQFNDIVNAVVLAIRQQPQNPTTPLLSGPALPPGFDALTLQQMKLDVAAAQTRFKTIEENHGKLQEAVTKQQEQITTNYNRQRDFNHTIDALNGRLQNVESAQSRNTDGGKKVAEQLRFLQTMLIGMGVALAILLITVLFLLLTRH